MVHETWSVYCVRVSSTAQPLYVLLPTNILKIKIMAALKFYFNLLFFVLIKIILKNRKKFVFQGLF